VHGQEAGDRDGPEPLVSVVMPVLDAGRYVRAALASIRGQTLDRIEILVLDGGSTDGTRAILAAEAAGDGRLAVIDMPGSGFVERLNRGLALSRASLVARMDADDIALPDRLAAQEAAMSRRPRLLALGGQGLVIDADGRRLRAARYPVGAGATRAALDRSCPLMHPAAMLRRGAAIEAGGYRADLEGAEDYDFWLRLAERGEIDNLPETLLLYREHGGSMSRRQSERQALASAVALDGSRQRRRGRPERLPAVLSEPRGEPGTSLARALAGLDAARAAAMSATYHRTLAYTGALAEDWAFASFLAFLAETRGGRDAEERRTLADIVSRAALRLLRARQFRRAGHLLVWIARYAPRPALAAGARAAVRRVRRPLPAARS